MNILYRSVVISIWLFAISGCVSLGNTPQEKRQAILNMKNAALTELFAKKPSTRTQVNSAPGYAVFSNGNLNLVLASFGGGYGMVKDNGTKHVTYMKAAELGLGFGLGVKDYRIIMVFNDKPSMKRFLAQGITISAQADAAAKVSDKGVAVAAEKVVEGVTVYQLTKSGLVLQATIKGSKFWLDKELN